MNLEKIVLILVCVIYSLSVMGQEDVNVLSELILNHFIDGGSRNTTFYAEINGTTFIVTQKQVFIRHDPNGKTDDYKEEENVSSELILNHFIDGGSRNTTEFILNHFIDGGSRNTTEFILNHFIDGGSRNTSFYTEINGTTFIVTQKQVFIRHDPNGKTDDYKGTV